MIKKSLLLVGFSLITSGCVTSSVTSNNGHSPDATPGQPDMSQRCLATNPKDVHLWINAMPGSGRGNKYPLGVSFTATTGTPGYQFALKVNRVMESYPEQVVLGAIVKSGVQHLKRLPVSDLFPV